MNLHYLFQKNKNNMFNSNNIKKYKTEYEFLCEKYYFLGETPSLPKLYWHYTNNINYIPKCKFCENNAVWKSRDHTYSNYCGLKCANKDAAVLEKRKETNIKKYGGESPFSSREIQAKRENTMLEKYGTRECFSSYEINEKIKNTNLKKYGCSNPLQNDEIQTKIKQTNLKKYGYENPMKNAHVYEKATNTKLEKYNSRNYNNMEKNKATILKKYGVEHISQKNIDSQSLVLLEDVEWLRTQNINNKKFLIDIAKELNVSLSVVSSRFKKHGIDVVRHASSIEQQEITEFLKQHTIIFSNVKNLIFPYEIDMFIPEKNLCVEYNGIFWHGELSGNRDRNYHLNKTIMCENNGYRLIHINSNEWTNKKDIVKSRLLQLIGKSAKIYARNCILEKIDYSDVNDFLNKNHIQGSIKSGINYGLYFNDELVSVMTFGKPRFGKQDEYELYRFCNKLGHTVIGGATKLFKAFINEYNPNNIITFSDRRWNTGSVYEKMGFNSIGTSPPNYHYYKLSNPNKLFSRVHFQKHKLKDKLEIFDDSKTEWENMIDNGFDRIWDCGNLIYRYSRN